MMVLYLNPIAIDNKWMPSCKLSWIKMNMPDIIVDYKWIKT